MADLSECFAGSTIQELAAMQGVSPLRDVAELAGVMSSDEVDEFLAAIDEHNAMEPERLSD